MNEASHTALRRHAAAAYRRSLKARPRSEIASQYLFRPLAHVVVRALLPLRVPPVAVLLAAAATGLAAAALLATGRLVESALVLQLKTVLDNADGQLARASGRVSALGRYLDTEADFLVNAALLGALGYATEEPVLAAAAFAVLTLVLSVDFNLERLYRSERGEAVASEPGAEGAGRTLAFLHAFYGAVFAPQDRLVRFLAERRLSHLVAAAGTAGARRARLAYHDGATLSVLANLGLSTQLAVLGVCLAAGEPEIYLWLVLACGPLTVLLFLRRERLARRALRAE